MRFFPCEKGKTAFVEGFSLKRAVSPFSRGKDRISQGVEHRGSLISVPWPSGKICPTTAPRNPRFQESGIWTLRGVNGLARPEVSLRLHSAVNLRQPSGPVSRESPRDYLSDTPLACALWGFWCLNMANWVRYPLPLFWAFPPWSTCEVEVRYPPSKGVSQRYLRDTHRLNAILSLLQPLDRYRTPSAIGSAIGRPHISPYLALSRIQTQLWESSTASL